MKSFAELFRRYRLRAEFETIAAFSDALAEKGYFYEESIFYHWQKGTRIPNSRELLLVIIKIFSERGAIRTLKEANEFLESAQQGYLTSKETRTIHFEKKAGIDVPFQVPSEIVHFTGREEVLQKIKKDLNHINIFLLHGPPGVGKTALAIKLGHLLKSKFSDGVLWYKVDSTNVMDILLSIAHLYGEDISEIKDIEVRASIVRTLLSNKKVLLIFDNVIEKHTLKLLLLNSSTSSIIFTSQESSHAIPCSYTSIQLNIFTHSESKVLFEKVFSKSFVSKYTKPIYELSTILGYLPLALNMAANFIKQSNISPQEYIEQLNDAAIDLHEMKYEDKNLFRAITISFDTLDQETRMLFTSLGVFEGKDFSWEAVAFVSKLSESDTKHRLKKLIEISLVEESNNQRYRIHPLIKIFLRRQIKASIFLRTAMYYENLLTGRQEKQSQKQLLSEVDNIIYVFKKCYEIGYWDQVITLWNPVEKFLSDNNEIKKLRLLTSTIDTAPQINFLQKLLTGFMIVIILSWVLLFLSGLKSSIWNYFWGALWDPIPVVGGFISIYLSQSWGLFRTNIGKSIFFISAGIFIWGTGNIIWLYYNFTQNIEIPYPSFADLCYLTAALLWIIGVIYLSRATGTKFSLKLIGYRVFFLFIPLIIAILSYYLLLFVVKPGITSSSFIKSFLDLAYPSMDIIILTYAISILCLSANFFSGKYKFSLFAILSGFICLYISDLTFAYTTTLGIYYNGSIFELFFVISFALLTWGTLSFYLAPNHNKSSLHLKNHY